MRRRSGVRKANGIVSAAIACFFLVHGLLGSLAPVAAFESPLRWVVWVGIGLVVVHVVLCVATSREQLTDAEFPPSARKKRHLVLKWATGGVLAVAACVHVACLRIPGAFAAFPWASAVVAAVLAALLAWHVFVGMKSLIKDVGLPKDLIAPARVAICALAVVIGVAVFAALFVR